MTKKKKNSKKNKKKKLSLFETLVHYTYEMEKVGYFSILEVRPDATLNFNLYLRDGKRNMVLEIFGDEEEGLEINLYHGRGKVKDFESDDIYNFSTVLHETSLLLDDLDERFYQAQLKKRL